ncbi:MAG: efflux RND transporter periplasmic adaptor subunit [Chloroflexi bacterium]|nr:efflux RND transporter periplasmic adaptor subunit [Chloroflexota bacterium]
MRHVLFVTVLLAAVACAPPWQTGEPPTRVRSGVRTTQVMRGDVTSLLVYPGEIRPKAATTITTRVAGRLDKLIVESGMTVREGDTVAELDRAALEVQVVQAQAQLAGAEARLAALKAGGEPDARAEAEASLRAARARLASLEAAPRIETLPQLAQAVRDARQRLAQVEDTSGAIASAEIQVNAARSQLDALLTSESSAAAGTASDAATQASPTASPQPADRVAVQQARLAVQQAQADLMRARQPASSDEITAARQRLAEAEDALLLARTPVGENDLEAARANVEAAEARLRAAGQPASETAVKAGESGVEYAWATLELARLQLREASLISPINGLVVETYPAQGAPLPAGAAVMSIQPLDYELTVSVEERQLSQVKLGQTVSVLVDAYPGESFTGTIRSLAPVVDPRTRLVTTRIDVADPQTKLKSGLYAQAAIAGNRRSGALLVPREALLPGQDPSVMLVVDNRARRQAIQVGVSDGRSVEILQGLAEGAEVILSPAGILDGDLLGEH